MLVSFGCQSNEVIVTPPSLQTKSDLAEPCIVLMADDAAIPAWYNFVLLPECQSVKLTLYISNFHHLSQEEHKLLKQLQNLGHDVQYHTLNHPNLKEVAKRGQLSHYFRVEIDSGLQLMRDAGYNPVYFAFPFSETIDSLDSEFFLRFKTLRVWGDDSSNFSAATENLYIWQKSQKYIRNLSIDRSSKVNSNQLREAIRFAKDKRLGLPVLFHGIDENPNNSYACSLDTLLNLVRIAQEEGIPFKTLSEVVE
jgi:peptidoglycan/xylan/chitin deacetylase (PgdA/CDA1 family)